MLKWFKILLSDSKQASVRRFIGLQSFYLLVTIIVYALLSKTPIANIEVVKQTAPYLFTIVMATIIGTTITNVADIIKNSYPPQKEEYDPFDISKDDIK